MTTAEQQITHIVRFRPNEWLNVHGSYIGEVLALQLKGVVESRVEDGQLQVRARTQPQA